MVLSSRPPRDDTTPGLLDAIAVAVLLVTPDGVVAHVNRAAQALLGADGTGLGACGFEAWVPASGRVQLQQALRAIASGQAWRGYMTIRTRGGASVDADVRVTPIATEDAAQGAIATIRPLRDALAHMLWDNATDVVTVHGPSGDIIFVSPSVREVLGYEPHEFVGPSFGAYIHDDDRASFSAWVETLRTAKQRVTLTFRFRRKDGSFAWLESTATSEFDPFTGELVATYSSARDISDRIETQEALRESEERYRLLAEHATDMISRQDREGRFTYVSPSCRELLGYEPDELMRMDALSLVHEDDRALVEQQVATLGSSPSARVTCRLQRKDGSHVWVESTDTVLRDSQTGRISSVQSITRDISERMRVDEALRRSEERYRLLAEHSTDIILRNASNGTVLYISPSVEAVLGYKPDELIGTVPIQIVHPDDLERVIQLPAMIRAAGTSVTLTYRGLHRDGHTVTLEARSVLVACKNGAGAFEVYSVLRDVTDRMRMQEQLSESLATLDTLVANSPIGIAIVNRDLRYVRVNDALAAINGASVSAHIGRTMLEMVPTVNEEHVAQFRRVIETGEAFTNTEMAGYTNSAPNEMRHWLVSCYPMRIDGGPILGAHIIVNEITERKRAEQALRASEERFRKVFEQSHVGLAFIGSDARFFGANRALCEMLDLTEDDLTGRTLDELTTGSASVDEHCLAALGGEAAAFSAERQYARPDGEAIWLGISVSTMRDDDGHCYLLAVIEDISERRRVEDELRTLASLKSEFVALVSHELRAPLTNINGGLELAKVDAAAMPDSAARAIGIVSQEAHRLTRLVESILDISRLDAGQLPLVPGPIALDPLIARVTHGEEYAGRVELQPHGALPLVWADEVYLEHVLRNIVANAAKYSSEKITIAMSAQDHRVRVTISDAGPGITPGDAARIFEPFFRSGRTGSRSPGYGLGLYFARRLLEAQGGTIEVQSPILPDPATPGSSFIIALPTAPEVA